MSVSAQRLFDVSLESQLGAQLDWLEVFPIFRVEKHQSNDGPSFIYLERVASQNLSLYYEMGGVAPPHLSAAHEFPLFHFGVVVEQQGGRLSESVIEVERGIIEMVAIVEAADELALVALADDLGIDGVQLRFPKSNLNDLVAFGTDLVFVVDVLLDLDVHRRHFPFIPQQPTQ